MLVLLSLVLTHFIRNRFKKRKADDSLKAVPAYVQKKRLPFMRKQSLPENIPTAYY